MVEDFRFDQIVLTNVKFGAVEWETIAGGHVRQKLDKWSLTRFSGQFTCRHHAASAAAAGLLS